VGNVTVRRRSLRFAIGLALAASVVTAVETVPVEATNPMEFGARVATRGSQTPNQAITAMETAIGRPYNNIRIFKLWNDAWPDSHANWLADTGHTVILSVKSRRTSGSIIS